MYNVAETQAVRVNALADVLFSESSSSNNMSLIAYTCLETIDL